MSTMTPATETVQPEKVIAATAANATQHLPVTPGDPDLATPGGAPANLAETTKKL